MSICQFMDVAVMSAGLYTQSAVQCVNKKRRARDLATATRFIKRRQSVHTCKCKNPSTQTEWNLWSVSVLHCDVSLLLTLCSVCMCCCRSQHSRCPGGRSSRPPTHAPGQHAAGRGRGRAGERRRICSCCSCGSGLGWNRRQLHRTFWLQSQIDPDQTDLPHRAGEIWAGKWTVHVLSVWASDFLALY